ncbi:hypothetical protein AVEN_265187-1 [Araneus ventricosus]|uniref:Uncharacterized protein n=1 Tax=Araneus ventricosus TaxID=182803 RepID=A0A4Y2CNZ0_ARAVE|nr:hypothetical protein AVEN_265187-1 [Araneus ventricosus]
MAPRAVDGDLMLEDKVKFFKEKLNGLHDIFRRVSEKKSTNVQDKDEFSNYKADILMLYVEAVSSLVPEKNLESEETSSMMDLFIELKNEFAAFRKGIYSKVDGFSKPICPTNNTIQNEDPRPSLQREIIETELRSETSTYASVAQTSSAIPEGPDTTVNDITNFLAPLNLKFLQSHRLKTKYQSYASSHIEVYENDLQQLLDSTFLPEGCVLSQSFMWCTENRLHLNIEKCSALSYTRRAQPLNHVYQINNLVLSRSNTDTDLGMIFDIKLDFSQHIDTMVSKTYRRLGILKRRTREFSSELTLKVLYCAHVRSNLEYCILDPNYQNKIEIIERIQNNFLRYLRYKKNGFYFQDVFSSLLRNIFNMPSLCSRRDVYCVLFFYKVINGSIDNDKAL